MFLLLGAFLAGMLTVLAPCVLALLPIIIGGSLQGDTKDRKRPIIIAVSLALSILLFTLLLKATSLLIDISPRTITYISGGIIIAVGILTLFPALYAKALIKLGIEHRAQTTLGKSFQNKRQFIGPVITGIALGPVFSSCSPVYAYILATILPVNFAQAMAYIVSYIIGLTIVLLLIGYYGQRFIGKISFASDPKGWFQRAIAILFIIVGLLVATGYDKKFQTYVSEHTPFNFDALSSKLLPANRNAPTKDGIFNVEPYPAPEFKEFDGWINSEPLTIQELKGKVVLVDFWTYSCINCIRNNPYLESWQQKYKDQGFTVIGSHAPEFAFEKNRENVERAVKDQKISYPVALDNDFATWNAFQNRSWPTAYLIDAQGNVRRVHEGEGQYAETEQAIRELLSEKGANLSRIDAGQGGVVPVREDQTAETYLGLRRASNYTGTPALGVAPLSIFTPAPNLRSNEWTLSGSWQIDQEKIIARGNSKLQFKVNAKEAYIVAASSETKDIGVTLNGQPISSTNAAGQSVKDSKVKVQSAELYRILSYPSFTKDGTLELTVPDGVEINVFTFGS